EPGEKDDEISGLGAAEAEGAAGTPAVVTVGRRRRVEVRVEVHRAVAPAFRRVLFEPCQVAEPEHGMAPRLRLRDGKERERPVGEKRGAGGGGGGAPEFGGGRGP